MYNVSSKQAEEFIDHQEILDTLDYAHTNKDNRALIESLLEKAASCKGLSHREASSTVRMRPAPTWRNVPSIWHEKLSKNYMAIAS